MFDVVPDKGKEKKRREQEESGVKEKSSDKEREAGGFKGVNEEVVCSEGGVLSAHF